MRRAAYLALAAPFALGAALVGVLLAALFAAAVWLAQIYLLAMDALRDAVHR